MHPSPTIASGKKMGLFFLFSYLKIRFSIMKSVQFSPYSCNSQKVYFSTKKVVALSFEILQQKLSFKMSGYAKFLVKPK